MIWMITETRKIAKEKRELLLGSYLTKGELDDDIVTIAELSENEMFRLMDSLGMKRKSEWVGQEAAKLQETGEVYILLELFGTYKMGKNCQEEETGPEIIGRFREVTGNKAYIETGVDDRYIECRLKGRALRRMKEIFGQDNLSGNMVMYSHELKKAFLGYRIK